MAAFTQRILDFSPPKKQKLDPQPSTSSYAVAMEDSESEASLADVEFNSTLHDRDYDPNKSFLEYAEDDADDNADFFDEFLDETRYVHSNLVISHHW